MFANINSRVSVKAYMSSFLYTRIPNISFDMIHFYTLHNDRYMYLSGLNVVPLVRFRPRRTVSGAKKVLRDFVESDVYNRNKREIILY